MKYITGIHALNLPCALDTCGDWHQSGIQWEAPQMRDTETAFFGEYGVEPGHRIPEHKGTYAVANTIRALLDLLYEGNFAVAQGMREDYICNESYTEEVFGKVFELRVCQNWALVSGFMGAEYGMAWVRFLQKKA